MPPKQKSYPFENAAAKAAAKKAGTFKSTNDFKSLKEKKEEWARTGAKRPHSHTSQKEVKEAKAAAAKAAALKAAEGDQGNQGNPQ